MNSLCMPLSRWTTSKKICSQTLLAVCATISLTSTTYFDKQLHCCSGASSLVLTSLLHM